jgi:hypothetical protein
LRCAVDSLVEKPEELDGLATAVAVLDQGMDFSGHQVDSSQQADRALPLVLVIACEGRMDARLGGKSGAAVPNSMPCSRGRSQRQRLHPGGTGIQEI